MARQPGSLVQMSVSKEDQRKFRLQLTEMIKFGNAKVTKIVADKTLNAINSSGSVPVLTGHLKMETIKMKDKFSPTGHIIGWVGTAYARKVYYGARTKSRFVTVNGQRRRGKYYKRGGQPFWDRPITRDKTLMIQFYRDAVLKVYNDKK